MPLRPAIARLRRRTFEAFGSSKYSRPALNDLDRKLERHLSFRNGFFVEAGANDGYNQSNTYYFEKMLDWSGILIEGIPELYKQCVKERKKSRTYHCALVSDDFEGKTVSMHYANLMSLVDGARKSHEADDEHIRRGISLQKRVVPYHIVVPARTLTNVLDEAGTEHIDLLSLDVEGYELQVLRGLDLTKYRPTYILIEANYRDEIDNYLAAHAYTAIDELSHHDILYRSHSFGV